MKRLNKKALLVDDMATNRVALGQLFEQFGFEVVQANSGAEAVKIYEEDPSFDLVVIDIDMPGMNGFTAAKMIRQYQMAKRPYIIGTAATPEYREKASQSGIDIFVVKSLAVQVIQQKVGPFSVINGGAR